MLWSYLELIFVKYVCINQDYDFNKFSELNAPFNSPVSLYQYTNGKTPQNVSPLKVREYFRNYRFF